MTSRERVWKAIHHQKPDRLPIDLGGTYVTGIHVDEYIEIGKYLGIDIEFPKVFDTFQMLSRAEGPILHWLHSDVQQVESLVQAWDYPNTDWKPWTTAKGNRVLVPGVFHVETDQNGVLHLYNPQGTEVGFMPSGGLYFDRAIPTGMSDEIKLMDPAVWKQSIPLLEDEELKILEKRARYLHDYTDYSIVGDYKKVRLGSSSLFAGHTFAEWMCILVTEEKYAREILWASAERFREDLALYLQAVGPYIDTILMSTTDFGTQRGEMFNPDIFKELYVPAYKLVNDYVHQYGDIKTMYHCCGSIRGIIPHFIESGADILNPIQYRAANMDLTELKNTFGDKLVFWGGGLDTQYTLPFGTRDEIIEEVKKNIGILGRDGGAVFALTHNLQSGVPPENLDLVLQIVSQHRY
jgi:uroporphyrinogen decarboxylase